MASNTTNDKIYTAVDATRREIMARIDHLENKIDSNYVTKEELAPIRAIVYGMVGLIMVAFLTGVIALVIKR